MSAKIDLACKVAAKAHYGVKRKGTETPYITHPMAVAIILAQAGASEDVIAAALLHDTVEDTDVTLQDIAGQFGGEVARVVAGCSEPDKKKSWEERKEHTIGDLKTAAEGVWLVICGDKLHNVRNMALDYSKYGDDMWERFNRGKEKQVWYYSSLVESLACNRDYHPGLFDEFKEEVDKFLEKIL